MDEKKDIVEVSFNGKENYNNPRKNYRPVTCNLIIKRLII